MKECAKCEEAKEKANFHVDNSRKDGFNPYCKDCRKTNYENNKEQILQKRKEYYRNNKELISEKKKKRYKEDKKEINKKRRERRKNNKNLRIKSNLRLRIWHALNENSKSNNTMNLLGCSIENFKKYLERQFTEKMSWNNYGNYWEIDHIIPCDSYNLENDYEQEECFYYTNLQPLEKTLNRQKSNKLKFNLKERG